jgi:predicted ester cyclase
VSATGKRIDFRSMGFNRFSNGIVVENWGLQDHARALEQLRSEK